METTTIKKGIATHIGADREFKKVTKRFNVELFYTPEWLKPNVFLIEFVFFPDDFEKIEENLDRLKLIEIYSYTDLCELLGEDDIQMYCLVYYWCDESKKMVKIEDDRLWELVMDEILIHYHRQSALETHEIGSELMWYDVIEHPIKVELKDILEVDISGNSL